MGIPFTSNANYFKDIKNLKDLAIQSLPPSRLPYDSSKLTGTKQLNSVERGLYNKTTQLRKIVVQDLLKGIYPPLLQELQSIGAHNDTKFWVETVGNIHPTALSTGHSTVIDCETDTQTRAHYTIFRPSLLLLHQVLKHRKIPQHQWPELGFASFGKVNPDGRLCRRGTPRKCILTIEYKTPSALDTDDESSTTCLTELQTIPPNVVIVDGQAMRFTWPAPDKLTEKLTGDQSDADKQTRIIIQASAIPSATKMSLRGYE